jgi:predicted ATPase/DNA-binding SARP family transcriptional activator
MDYPKARSQPFVGRQNELRFLVGCFDSVLQNQGGFVLIEGETGIGKTRLVEQFLAKVRSQGAMVIRGQGYHKEISPYRLFSEMLRDYFSSINYDTRQLAPLLDNLTVALMEKIVPELAEYIPFDISRIRTPSMSPREEKQRFYDMLLLFFTKLSHRYPLVLDIEDLHWLEPDTLELLRYLISNFRKSPILVVATSRGAEAGSSGQTWVANLEDQRLVRRMRLPSLNAEEVRTLVEDFFDQKLGQGSLQWFLDYSAGNPLFVNETLKAGTEHGAFFFDEIESLWEIKPEYRERMVEPPTLQSVIDRRLKGLDGSSRNLLSIAAVAAEKFDPSDLNKLTNLPATQVAATLGDLVDRGLLTKMDRREPGEEYRFTHHIVRHYVYQNLDPGFKEEYHARWAAMLEKEKDKAQQLQVAEVLGYHFSRGKKDRNSVGKSVKYLMEAGRKMREQYCEGQAEQYYLQAQEILNRLSPSRQKYLRQIGLQQCLGEVQGRMGRSNSAIQSYLEALRLGDHKKLLDNVERAELYRKIGYVYHSISDYSQAVAFYQKAMRELKRKAGDRERMEYITICNLLGLTHAMKGEYSECTAWSQKAIRLARKREHLSLLEKSYNNLGWVAYSQGKYEEAIGHFNRCLEIQDKVQDKSRLSALKVNLGVIYLNLGQYDKAEDYYLAGLSLAKEMGNLSWKGIIYNNLGVLYKDRGEWDKALSFLERSLRIREQYQDRRGMASALDNLGVTFLSQGQLEKARQYLERSFEVCKQIGAKDILPLIQTDLGMAYFRHGDRTRAEDLVNAALRLADEQSSRLSIGTSKRTLGQFRLAAGKLDEAGELLQESKAVFEQLQSTYQLAQTLQSLGICQARRAVPASPEARRDLSSESIRTLSRAVEILTGLNFEKRLLLLADDIRQNQLEQQLRPVLEEIDRSASHMRESKEATEEPADFIQVGEGGDYLDHLRIYCFGRLRVCRPFETDEIPAKEWGSIKARQILAYLVVQDPKKVGATRDKLVDAIWPQIDPRSLGNTFHVTLSHLRKALKAEKGDYLTSDAGVYRLNWEGKIWSDVSEFLSCLDSAARFQEEEKQHLMDSEYRKAADLYSSNLLEDFYDDWAEDTREHYREKYNVVFRRLAQSAWDKADYESCIRYLQSLLLSDPTDEEAHRMIMISYALLGSRTAAIRQFKVCENNMRRYLEVEPEPVTVDLHKRIKHGNPKDYRKLLSLVG